MASTLYSRRSPPPHHRPSTSFSPHHSNSFQQQQQQQMPSEHHQQQQQQLRKSRSETALTWFLRSRQQRQQQQRRVEEAAKPTDPVSAAWAFFRSTTGIPFVDEALWRIPQGNSTIYHVQQRLPALEIRGNDNNHMNDRAGKTRTLLSLAARYVVATRPSLFTTTSNNNAILPQVIICDSTLDMTPLKLAYAISSLLLRQSSSSEDTDGDNDSQQQQQQQLSLEQDIQACLSRIHLAHVQDISEWVPMLESLRWDLLEQQQQQQQAVQQQAESSTTSTVDPNSTSDTSPTIVVPAPTLLLWDGLLSEPSDAASRMEVTRQLARLVQDCPVGLVYTTSATTTGYGSNSSNNNNNRLSIAKQLEARDKDRGGSGGGGPVALSVRLERKETQDGRHHDFVATLLGTTAHTASSSGGHYSSLQLPQQHPPTVPYSLSAAGVLR